MWPPPDTSCQLHSSDGHQGQPWLGGYRMSPHFAHLRRTSFRRWRASLKCSRHSESFSGITSFMPRYSTLAMGRSPRSVVEDQGRAGGRHRPAEIHGNAGVPTLPALARRVVVGVLAVRRSRAGVVHGAPQLAHVLDDHAHAVGVALAEMPARGIVGPLPAQLDDAAGDVGPALALLAEAILLELEHGGEGEGVVGAGDVHVLRPDAGLAEHDLLGVVAGHAADRPMRPVEVEARLVDAAGDAHDVGGLALEVARALGPGDGE